MSDDRQLAAMTKREIVLGIRRGKSLGLEAAVALVMQKAADAAGVPVERMQGKPAPSCDVCRGTGKVSHPWRGTVSPCEACYGTGKVPV